uniref:Uncharacterized protein n=1 Tax=Onchocerca volvulus TaxID=6282 RepID=A0A8R1TY38_ONCVO
MKSDNLKYRRITAYFWKLLDQKSAMINKMVATWRMNSSDREEYETGDEMIFFFFAFACLGQDDARRRRLPMMNPRRRRRRRQRRRRILMIYVHVILIKLLRRLFSTSLLMY